MKALWNKLKKVGLINKKYFSLNNKIINIFKSYPFIELNIRKESFYKFKTKFYIVLNNFNENDDNSILFN